MGRRSTIHDVTRRQFLASGAVMTASTYAGVNAEWGTRLAIPFTPRTRSCTPSHWLADPIDGGQLRTLAATAMDAARAAGADFADVRIGVQRRVQSYGGSSDTWVGMSFGYGIRAWSRGTWSFQHGNVMTADAVAATARSAAAGARTYAAVNDRLARHRRLPPPTEWAPVPVATGSWQVPMSIDPFTVSLDDYRAVIDSLTRVTVPRGVWNQLPARAFGYVLSWRAETRIFASMDGALVTQDTICGGLGIQATATLPSLDPSDVFLHQPDGQERCAGFETALDPEIPARIQKLYDDAVRWEELPFRPMRDVGRFPVVFDGATMARVIGQTIGNALDGDRLAGLEADASGGSMYGPILDTVRAGKPLLSPRLTVTARRTLPSPMAVQWDDDGVVPEAYTLVDRGQIVDMHTTRETAPTLADWYRMHGRPVRSHGCAVASTPASVPRGTGGHMFVTPATQQASLAELLRGVSHGFLIVNGAASASPGLTTGGVSGKRDGVMLEVRNGVPVARTSMRTQFVTQTLLDKQLVALGDARTQGTAEVESAKGIPWQTVSQRVTAPAAFCADVDVLLP